MTKEEFKNRRRVLSFTQAQIGEKLGGYSQTDISHWESGVCKIPKAVVKMMDIISDK